MASVQAAFGTIKGKIGNLRFSDWNGVNTVAQQPASYTDAKTAVQVSNRSSFKALSLVGRQVITAIRQGLSQYSYKTSPWAQFMKLSKDAYVDINGVISMPKPEDFIIARGDLPGLALTNAAVQAPHGFEFNFADNSAAFGAHATDNITIVAVHQDGEGAIVLNNVGKRNAQNINVILGSAFMAKPFHVYAFLSETANPSHTSDSVMIY